MAMGARRVVFRSRARMPLGGRSIRMGQSTDELSARPGGLVERAPRGAMQMRWFREVPASSGGTIYPSSDRRASPLGGSQGAISSLAANRAWSDA
jgi:hypothetical protein